MALIQWRLHQNEVGIDRVEEKVGDLRVEYEKDRTSTMNDRLTAARKASWTLVGIIVTAVGMICSLLIEISRAKP